MRLQMGQQMRMGQQMKLAPRMIQCMEILQLSDIALEDRLEQELMDNVTLERRETGADREQIVEERIQNERDACEGERDLVVDTASNESKNNQDDFERLTNIAEQYGEEWLSNTTESFQPYQQQGERDGKMDAMNNAAAKCPSLTDQMLQQWILVETDNQTRELGEYMIGWIDNDGYLRTDWQTIFNMAPAQTTSDQLIKTLRLIQKTMEPIGIGARNVRECLMLQINARLNGNGNGNDNGGHRHNGNGTKGNGNNDNGRHLEDEDENLMIVRKLVDKHLENIENNRLPKIAREEKLSVEQVQDGIRQLRKFHFHPGRLLVEERPTTITPEAIIEFDEDEDRYVAKMMRGRGSSVHIPQKFIRMVKDKSVDKSTRQFVNENLKSAEWLIDALKQRDSTMQRILNIIVEAQRDYFENGPEHLKPLPMVQVADQLGIHIGTVSRAVANKYAQTPRGIVPLRMFFSGGITSETGEQISFTAIQNKVKHLIDAEDKTKPLSDDDLVKQLKTQGIEMARRTVAKYRKQLHVPSARQRKEF